MTLKQHQKASNVRSTTITTALILLFSLTLTNPSLDTQAFLETPQLKPKLLRVQSGTTAPRTITKPQNLQQISVAGVLSCLIYFSDTKLYFDLSDLQSETGYSKEVSFTNDKGEDFQGKIYFNFCTRAANPVQICSSKTGTFGFLYNNDVCYPLTSAKTEWEEKALNDDPDPAPEPSNTLTASANATGLYVYGNNTDNTGNVTAPFDIAFQLNCKDRDFSIDSVQYVDPTEEDDRPYLFINMTGPSGCPTDVSGFIDFFEKNPWVYGIFLVIFGAFICFFGFLYLRQALGITGFFTGFIGLLIIILWFWNYKTATAAQFIFVLFICLCIGFLIGYVFYASTKIAVCGAAGFIGIILAGEVFTLIEGFLDKTLPQWTYFIIVVVFLLAFITLGLYLHDHCLIISTSVAGAYLLVLGVGTIVGDYPSTKDFAYKIANGEIGEIPWQWWAYLAGTIVLVLISLFIQYRQRKKTLENDEGENNWKAKLAEGEYYE